MEWLLLLPYALFVIGGWCRVKPLDYRLSDYFFEANWWVNEHIFRSKTGRTVSSDAYYDGGWKMYLINLIALDPWHCYAYRYI